MNRRAVMIPGGTRLRSMHAVDRNGSCEVVYDLERNLLVEVPELFQYHIAVALEREDIDEGLMSWLAGEDLLTYDETLGRLAAPRTSFSELADFFDARDDGIGCAYFVDDQAHCRIRRDRERETSEILECLCGERSAISRVTLHLGSEGAPVDFPWLRRLVDHTAELAGRSDKQVSYELWMAAQNVTPTWAKFLAENPFRVRVHCDGAGGAGSWFTAAAERGLILLQEHLGERLTVHSILGGERLADLWAWAREMGLAHLHATALDVHWDDVAAREADLRQFRFDLRTVCEDMWTDLKAGIYPPLLYEPVVRAVRRLVRGGTRSARRAVPYLGMIFQGRMVPIWSTGTALSGAAHSSGEKGAVERQPCDGCWARLLCGRGPCADPALGSAERIGSNRRHCGLWGAEAEAAVLFYRRLQEEDPEFLLGLAPTTGAADFDSLDAGDGLVELVTC